MKYIIQTILFLSISISAWSQDTYEVIKDSSYVYFVTPKDANYNYKWSVTGGTSTDVTSLNKDSIYVIWDGAVSSTPNTLKIYAEDKTTGCLGNSKSRKFVIVDTLSYTATVNTFTNTCPQTDMNPTGGNDASFKVEVIGATVAATDTVTVQYAILGEGAGTGKFIGTSSGTIALNNKAYTNVTGVSITKTVEITAVKVTGRNAVSFPAASKPKGTFTISASPEISEIQF